jgi:hypothetical protein
MAKKAEATSATETPRRRVGKQNSNAGKQSPDSLGASVSLRLKSSTLLDTRVVYCGGPCRTGHHWGETREKRAFEDRHENTKAYIDLRTGPSSPSAESRTRCRWATWAWMAASSPSLTIAQPFMAGFTVRNRWKSRPGRKNLAHAHHCLPSLTGLGRLGCDIPSHK